MTATDTQQPKRFQCRHIHTDGRRCGSPALRNEEFCYYHHTSRRPAPGPAVSRRRQATFDLPLPEDRAAIQLSIGEILRRIATNQIDPRRAGLLLYGLQIASTNLPQRPSELRRAAAPVDIAGPVEEIVLDPSLGTLAPRSELALDGPNARQESLTEQLLAELARGRDTLEHVCPSCKAQQQQTRDTPETGPSDVPEILDSLNASGTPPSPSQVPPPPQFAHASAVACSLACHSLLTLLPATQERSGRICCRLPQRSAPSKPSRLRARNAVWTGPCAARKSPRTFSGKRPYQLPAARYVSTISGTQGQVNPSLSSCGPETSRPT